MYCHCRYLIYIYVSNIYIHVLPLVVYSTLLACWECVCMDEVTCSIYTYCTIYLHNSACRQGVCLCGQSRYLIRIYVSDIYVHIEHILPQFVYSIPLTNRECDCVDKVACSMYVYAFVVWILSLPYIHIVAIIRIYVSDIHIHIVTIREFFKNGLKIMSKCHKRRDGWNCI